MYVCTRVLPSISIDDGFFRHCSLVTFAKVLDLFSGIECYAATVVGLQLQKFWISLAESSVKLALERRFGWPDGAKLALERRCGRPDGVKLALERRFGRPDGAGLALERHFGRPTGKKSF